eukprot:374035-Pelagomonas_calceolata.AAC.12
MSAALERALLQSMHIIHDICQARAARVSSLQLSAIPAVAGTVGALLVEKRKNFLFYEKVRVRVCVNNAHGLLLASWLSLLLSLWCEPGFARKLAWGCLHTGTPVPQEICLEALALFEGLQDV